MQMAEQNGGKFRRLKKDNKYSVFVGIEKFLLGKVIAWCVDLEEKIKKNSLWALNLHLKKEHDK